MDHTASSTVIRGELTEQVSQQSGGLRTIPAPVDTLTIGDSRPFPSSNVSDPDAPRRSWPSRVFRRSTSEAGLVALDRIRGLSHRGDLARLQIPNLAPRCRVTDGQRLLRVVVPGPPFSSYRFRMEPLTVGGRYPLVVVQAPVPGPGDARPGREHRQRARWRGCRAPSPRRAARMGREDGLLDWR